MKRQKTFDLYHESFEIKPLNESWNEEIRENFYGVYVFNSIQALKKKRDIISSKYSEHTRNLHKGLHYYNLAFKSSGFIDFKVYFIPYSLMSKYCDKRISEIDFIKSFIKRKECDIETAYRYFIIPSTIKYGPKVAHCILQYLVKEDKFYIEDNPLALQCLHSMIGDFIYLQHSFHPPIPNCLDGYKSHIDDYNFRCTSYSNEVTFYKYPQSTFVGLTKYYKGDYKYFTKTFHLHKNLHFKKIKECTTASMHQHNKCIISVNFDSHCLFNKKSDNKEFSQWYNLYGSRLNSKHSIPFKVKIRSKDDIVFVFERKMDFKLWDKTDHAFLPGLNKIHSLIVHLALYCDLGAHIQSFISSKRFMYYIFIK